MTRLIGPDEGSRLIIRIAGTIFTARRNRPVTVYSDAEATTLADIRTLDNALIPDSVVHTDTYSMLPLFRFPDGMDTLYVVVDGGPAWPIYARTDDRLDGLLTSSVQKAANLSDLANVSTSRANLDVTAARPRDRRLIAPRWDQSEGLSVMTSTGLTITSGKIAATVGGTNGDAVLPIYGTKKELRVGFQVVATKSTVGSRATVGFVCSAPGVLPTGTDKVFGAGYKQGFGIGLVRDNVGDIVILQDSLITDGDVFDIGVLVDQKISLRGDIYATMSILARRASDGGEWRTTAIHSPVTFPVNNMHIRTNIAGGSMSNVQIANHQLATVGVPAVAQLTYFPGQPTEVVSLRVPANPNGKLILALHGTGETLASMNSSVLYRGTWEALSNAGFTIALPRYGGDLWGNATGINYITDLYNQLVTNYDLDPDVFLWGNSMGGGSAAQLISDRPFPIRTAVLTEPALDYQGLAATALLEPYFTTAYPTIAQRDAADPMKRAASTYAGVPVMMVASPTDTTVARVSNADAFATKISPYAEVITLSATGNHGDASHYKPRPTLDWFRSHV